jgi:hypothetical protein
LRGRTQETDIHRPQSSWLRQHTLALPHTRKINDIEKERDQQLADLDRLLDGIERTSKKNEASESYLTASKLPQENGVTEARFEMLSN